MEEKGYRLIENEDGTLTFDILEGVSSVNEQESLATLERVAVINIPDSIECVYDLFDGRFCNLEKITMLI